MLYPTVIEPSLALSTQTRIWSFGYTAAVVLTIICAIVMWRRVSVVATPYRQRPWRKGLVPSRGAAESAGSRLRSCRRA